MACALRSGRTLKPMMIAFDAEASSTSDSLIAPTPEWITRILTLSLDSFCSVSASTSAEPPTSALMMIGSSLTSPSLHLLVQLIRACRRLHLRHGGFARLRLAVDDDLLGLGGVGHHLEVVAGFGQRFETEHFDRRRRLGFLRTCSPRSSSIARTLPKTAPQMKKSPTRSVPLRTSTVATGPRPRSSLASSTVPIAGRAGVGLEILQIGHQQNHFEQQIEILLRACAETGTMTVSPPQSSASRPRSASCCLMRSGCASGLSILLIATMIGTLAALA